MPNVTFRPPAVAGSNTDARITTPSRRGRRWTTALFLGLGIASLSPSASAEKLLIDAVVSAASGVEGADPGLGTLQWQRQRILLRLGAEWSASNTFQESFGVYGLIELERSGSFGAELVYRRSLNKLLSAHAGMIAILRPESLYGASGGFTGAFDISDALSVFIDLSATAFPFGSDRPTASAVVIWMSGSAGVRLHF
jgi:hypothetical protein